jgi:transposase
MLSELAGSLTAARREVERARILLAYADGKLPTEIQRLHGVSRPTIYKCIDKALAAGVTAGLKDRHHRAHAPQISEAAKAWVAGLACRKPKDLGLEAEAWTLATLTDYVTSHANAAGFARLASAGKATVWRILDTHALKPRSVRNFQGRRDAESRRTIAEVLLLYYDVSLRQIDAVHDALPVPLYAVSVNDRLGGQTPDTNAPAPPPGPGQACGTPPPAHMQTRHGTLSVLVALDLHTGEIIVSVEPRHASTEFTSLLQRLHAHYPAKARIRLVLDQNDAHISRETMAWLADHPGRFDYVHTPRHGPWLNLVEVTFSKLVHNTLYHVRVPSLNGLRQHILKYADEANAHPVRFRWSSSGFDMTGS